MLKERLTRSEQKLVRDYSQKGKSFPIGSFAQSREQCGRLSSVREGVINCNSGYLAVCDACNLEVYGDKTIIDPNIPTLKKEGDKYRINLNSPLWSPPKLLRGLDFLVFRNLWGNGLFRVLSRGNRFYVETKIPSFPDKEFLETIKRKKIIEKNIGQERFYFEGFVGIEGGSAAIVDPEIHKISYAQTGFSISTILEVEPGTYSCKFIEGNRRLSIRRLRAQH